MRVVCVSAFLCLACSPASGVTADQVVSLDSLKWKHRVLLLPALEGGAARTNWLTDRDGLLERHLVLFREDERAYRQWFPDAQTPTTLSLSPGLQSRAAGRVTLIGKDGKVKRQWDAERSDLRAAVFALIDTMPMRQRDMRAQARADGGDLVGTRANAWSVGPEWANSNPLRLADLRGRVVMVRFWTDTCPYCDASLPAMQKLAEEFEGEAVTFVGLYQSKPRGSERPWKKAVARANALGIEFPIAYDHHWQTLESWWLDGKGRRATSASFIIAPDGTIAHVHPGPVFFASDEPGDARANADYQALRQAIRAQLSAMDD